MRCCLMHHPRRYAGARPVRLRNDDELDAAIGESPDYQYGLAAPGMERIVDPSLDRVFVGSLSLFRADQQQRDPRPLSAAVRARRSYKRMAMTGFREKSPLRAQPREPNRRAIVSDALH